MPTSLLFRAVAFVRVLPDVQGGGRENTPNDGAPPFDVGLLAGMGATATWVVVIKRRGIGNNPRTGFYWSMLKLGVGLEQR